MTEAERRVLAVWPEAYVTITSTNEIARIWPSGSTDKSSIGCGYRSVAKRLSATEAAWSDAAARLPEKAS